MPSETRVWTYSPIFLTQTDLGTVHIEHRYPVQQQGPNVMDCRAAEQRKFFQLRQKIWWKGKDLQSDVSRPFMPCSQSLRPPPFSSRR